MPRDSTLKSRKFLELDSSLRPEATGTAMFESKSDKTVHPGMEGLPSPGGQTGRNTKLIPTRYSQLFNGPAEGSAQPHSQPCPSVQSLRRSQSKYFLYYCQLNKNDATVLVPTGQNSSQAISLKPRAAGEMPRALRSPEIDHTSLCASLSHLVNWKPAREGQIWRSSAHCCRAAGRTGRSQRRIRAGWRHASAPGDDAAAVGTGRRSHLLSSDREQPCGGGGAATVQPPPVLGQRLAGHPCADRSPGRGRALRLTAVPEAGSTLVFHESGKHQSRSLKHRLFDPGMDSVSHAGAGKPKTHP